jgi:hypothetical protein
VPGSELSARSVSVGFAPDQPERLCTPPLLVPPSPTARRRSLKSPFSGVIVGAVIVVVIAVFACACASVNGSPADLQPR